MINIIIGHLKIFKLDIYIYVSLCIYFLNKIIECTILLFKYCVKFAYSIWMKIKQMCKEIG